jgi:pimeloyl-ACP methyl ester carboxylesterase
MRPWPGKANRPTDLVETGAARVAVYRRGSGPPLVLVHGIPLSTLTWRHTFDALSSRFTVVAVDLKGFGHSTAAAGGDDWSPAGHARTIAHALDRLGIGRVSLAASSYGCAPASEFAFLFPGRVHRLVFINSVGSGEGSHHAERLARIGVAARIARPVLTSRLGLWLIGRRLKNCYASAPADWRELAHSYHHALQSSEGADAFLQTLRHFDEGAMASTLSALPHRTLLVWGARDPILHVSAAHRLRALMRNATLEIFERSGHFPHEEEPERFTAIVSAFLMPAPKEDFDAHVLVDEVRGGRAGTV